MVRHGAVRPRSPLKNPSGLTNGLRRERSLGKLQTVRCPCMAATSVRVSATVC